MFYLSQLTTTNDGPRYYSITQNHQHDHLNTATSPHQATSSKQQGMYEGSRRTGSSTSTSSLQEKAQTTRVALFGLYVSFFIILNLNF